MQPNIQNILIKNSNNWTSFNPKVKLCSNTVKWHKTTKGVIIRAKWVLPEKRCWNFFPYLEQIRQPELGPLGYWITKWDPNIFEYIFFDVKIIYCQFNATFVALKNKYNSLDSFFSFDGMSGLKWCPWLGRWGVRLRLHNQPAQWSQLVGMV